mmetsp:Transcript_19097/g.47734  ORF Transcript_19097/g.47734 Transcript_19097/m.47734 type:complete len:454 (-) Transcript_19097:20-1381(-)
MPSPTEGILFPPPDSSNAFAAEPPRKRSARALLISVRTLKPPRTRHRPPLRAEAATGAAGGPHSEASTRRGGTNVSRECIARSLCRSSTSPAFHWNATLERFMKSPKSSSAANSSSPKGVPSPNTTAFFGSLRESLQPEEAAGRGGEGERASRATLRQRRRLALEGGDHRVEERLSARGVHHQSRHRLRLGAQRVVLEPLPRRPRRAHRPLRLRVRACVERCAPRLADGGGDVFLGGEDAHVPDAQGGELRGEGGVLLPEVARHGVRGEDWSRAATRRGGLAEEDDVLRLPFALRHLVVERDLLGRRRLVRSEHSRRHVRSRRSAAPHVEWLKIERQHKLREVERRGDVGEPAEEHGAVVRGEPEDQVAVLPGEFPQRERSRRGIVWRQHKREGFATETALMVDGDGADTERLVEPVVGGPSCGVGGRGEAAGAALWGDIAGGEKGKQARRHF